MDRGLLSHSEVVKASREFVCIRLLTYECEEEAEFLRTVFVGRTGLLENSVFALLAPEGTKLTRGGRSPEMVFGREFGFAGEGEMARAMVAEMKAIAARYPGVEGAKGGEVKEGAKGEPWALPGLEDLRRALNAAACDLQPLVVVADGDAERRAARVRWVRELAWSAEFIGDFAYVVVSEPKEVERLKGTESGEGVFVVQPDAYGLEGRVLVEVTAVDRDAMARGMEKGRAAFEGEAKESRRHIRTGRRDGKSWTPEIPVTDPNDPRNRRRG